MRRGHLLPLLGWLSCSLAAPAALAQTSSIPPAVRSGADAISPAQLAWDLAMLSSDAFRGRSTPSAGFDDAADYVVSRLARAGLKGGGDGGGYRQHYELRETRVDTDAAAIEIGQQRFACGREFALRTLAAPVAGEFPVVYVGHGWVIPGRGIDPYSGLDVRGKLVVVAHALPKGIEVRQVGRVAVGAETPVVAAAARGAAGVLFIAQPAELLQWDAIAGRNTVRRELEPSVPSAYAAPPATSLLLSPPVTTALFDGEAVQPSTVLRLADDGEHPPSFQLKRTVKLHVPLAVTTVYRPYNVVAILEGSDPELRHEAVTVFSHLDGAVGTRSVNGDDVYNSADDNASGSAAVLNIAEQMARGPKPRRSIVFVWDSGEEQGLWGTRWFVHAPPVPLPQIVAHVNVDMIGASRHPGSADAESKDVTEPGEVFVIGTALSRQASSLLDRVNGEYLKLRFNRSHDTADSEFFYPRTDAGPFLERGVLTLGFTTGIHDRYHLPADEARALDARQLHVIARTVFASVWMLADSVERPGIDQPIPSSVPRYR